MTVRSKAALLILAIIAADGEPVSGFVDLGQWRRLVGDGNWEAAAKDRWIVSARDIAKRHFDEAVREAVAAGYDVDGVARRMLDCVVAKYLEYRKVKDVRSELNFVADNCDPDADFMFMRP
jgi:hypothetical protein